MAPAEHVSSCRICAPTCGVLVTVDGDEVLGVRGDPEHPSSRGYTCPKGRALGAMHHDPRRLDEPEVRIDGALTTTGWDAAVDDLAGRLREVIEASGPDAVAYYQGTPALQEGTALPVIGTFLRRIGTTSRYSSLTVDISAKFTVMARVFGAAVLPVVDVDTTRLLLVVGTNPVVSHGQYNGLADPITRLRAVARRGELWVVDPRRTETAHLATTHLAIRPGSDHALLAFLVRGALRRAVPLVLATLGGVDRLAAAVDGWDLDATAAATGLDAVTVEALDAAVARAGRISVLTGTGLTMARSGNASEWLALCLLLLTGSIDAPGGMWVNPTWFGREREVLLPAVVDDGRPGPASRPDVPRFLAEHPCAALVDEIESGRVRALLSFGGNPLLAIGESRRLRRAVAGLDVFAVVGTVRDGQADLATHLLPVTGMLERANAVSKGSDLLVSAQYSPAVLPPGAERRPSWWVFAQLAERLGVRVLPDGLDVATATDDDLIAAQIGAADLDELRRHPHGIAVGDGPRTGWVLDRLPRRPDLAPTELVEQFASLAAPSAEVDLQLIPRRRLRRFNSGHSPSGRQDEQEVVLAPADAAGLGIVDGDAVRLRTAFGEMVGRSVVDHGMRPGSVATSHGYDGTNVADLVGTRDVDPLTGMIIQTGVPVEVEPAR